MRGSKTLGLLAGIGLVAATPAIAAGPVAPSAARLSVANSPAVASDARAGAPTRKGNNLAGGAGWIIGAVGLVAGVTYALVEGDDDDFPSSN